MGDEECVRFLQWSLPRLSLKWSGYRKVRRTVCKRVERRLQALGLDGVDAYRALLEERPAEWSYLEACCRIPISRFYRDREVFAFLSDYGLPGLAARARARGDDEVRAWSAGCASGEEPYSLKIAWTARAAQAFPTLRLTVMATDAEEIMLRRASAACYALGSLKDLPSGSLERDFTPVDSLFRPRPALTNGVTFHLQDIRTTWPDGPFDLILCRNLAFTYFAEALQRAVLARLAERLREGGLFVIGGHETLPASVARLLVLSSGLPIYRQVAEWHDGLL